MIRTFFVWARKSKINRTVQIAHRQAKTAPTLTQEQRLAWIKELLTGDGESLPYRTAGILLLLYAQPLTKVAVLETSAIILNGAETLISLGDEPVPVPEPFATMLVRHMHHRPNLRTTGGTVNTPWLFPGRPGRHVNPQSLMLRLRALGVDLLGARNSALRHLVTEVPPPLVAELLGYSYQVTQRHAGLAAQPWAHYVTGSRS